MIELILEEKGDFTLQNKKVKRTQSLNDKKANFDHEVDVFINNLQEQIFKNVSEDRKHEIRNFSIATSKKYRESLVASSG